ncbi:CRTAC1 family protein [Armatimonas rosea]|uniref:ASPIC/UnbV domain-containing protein n=1 Tax=Armatimonas rosea TaxID=685828 RepID=A0A7W9W5S6_ARMRO|nr:CRTAC1 family protein [Armatimonas rosea]MBB6048887.1 hypothetical protein [Armatimonas rosea]
MSNLRRALLGAAALSLVLTGGSCPRAKSGEGATPPASATSLFREVAESAGLHYKWTIPGKRPLTILQTIGNGCAFLDYDNDGNLDILLVGERLALYKGDGKGHFTDVTAAVELADLKGHFLGCAVGDYDGDGYDDLYISGYEEGKLLKNAAGKAFTDVSAAAGVTPQPWGTSAAFAETRPGSGVLDLFVGNYAVFGPTTDPQLCKVRAASGEYVMTSCGPRYYQPRKGVFYQNTGKGQLLDVTQKVGALGIVGKTLGVAFADYENRGALGLALANDEMPGDLLRLDSLQGEPHYTNVAELVGTAFDRDGNMHGGMGTDWGDYDNDGLVDLFVATFQGETKSLYRNENGGRFMDSAMATLLGPPTQPYVAFGCRFLDYDNDGWLDIVIANGHVQDNIAQIESTQSYRQPTQLFRNKGGSPLLFEEVGKQVPDLQKPIVGRGLATGDYDNDGKLDLLIVDSEGAPRLLHNETPQAGHWLGLKLVGSKSNRDAYGAIVTVEVAGRKLTRHCHADGSYLSSSDPRVHIGIGTATTVDKVTIRWPSGQTETHTELTLDTYTVIKEK